MPNMALADSKATSESHWLAFKFLTDNRGTRFRAGRNYVVCLV